MASDEGVGRRSFVAGLGALATGSATTYALSTGRADGTARSSATEPPRRDGATVRVAGEADAGRSEWRIDDRIFGKFLEHNGRDAYPGIYSDHVANGSFEVWNHGGGSRTALIFDVDAHEGVAHGWEPVEQRGDVGFEHARGGVHGRRPVPDLDDGGGVPPWLRPDPAGVTEARYQRIHLGGRGGVRQRTALPDGRTRDYDVAVSVRGSGLSECAVELVAPDGRTLARSTVAVTESWTRHEVGLSLDARSETRYRGSPFGTYDLRFVGESDGGGDGRLDLDWVVLRAGDAVDGKFNPTTLRRLREFGVTSLRWPGGNFASQYRWRDGVGPLADRPVVPNCNWGGLERNSLGTNEFLAFCDLADVEPLLTVGAWPAIGPEEAAAWVEYVNGDRSTEMGSLRAEHGYPEPWDVTAWQVGNEVYGGYQVGHASADRYADRYADYHEAMTAADPSIEVDATGIDPGWTDYSDGSLLDRDRGTRPTWNDVVFERAGTSVAGLDLHRYVAGIRPDETRRVWRQLHGAGPVDYNQVLVAFPTQFGDLVEGLAGRAADAGVDDLRVTVGEWNLQPVVDDEWPRAGYPTAAHAASVASFFTTFLRHGDAVRQAHQRDNSLFHRPYHTDMRPVPPGNYVQRLFAAPFEATDVTWHHRPLEVDSPTFTIPETGFRIRETSGVPLLDATAIESEATADAGCGTTPGAGDAGSGTAPEAGDDRTRVLFAVNRSLRTTLDVTFAADDWQLSADGSSRDAAGSSSDEELPPELTLRLLSGAGGDPFAPRTEWDRVDGFDVTDRTVTPDESGRMTLTMPPASVARLTRKPVDRSMRDALPNPEAGPVVPGAAVDERPGR